MRNLGEAGEEVGGGEGCGERGGGETAREGVEGVKPPAPFGAQCGETRGGWRGALESSRLLEVLDKQTSAETQHVKGTQIGTAMCGRG